MTRFSNLLQEIPSASLGVVGDFCLDAYWDIDDGAHERSLETGKPTIAVGEQRYSLGGAGNVATNLAALGVQKTRAFGVWADDLFGRELIRQLRNLKINVGGFVSQDGDWQTPVYAKPHKGAVEQRRIDFGRFNKLSRTTEKKLIATLHEVIPGLDAVIVNQQLPQSIFTRAVVRTLNELASNHPEKIFLVDSRHRVPDFRSMICKLNAIEAAALFGKRFTRNEKVPHTLLLSHAQFLFGQFKRPVFITRGKLGLMIFDGNEATDIPAVSVYTRVDPVGAGDTVVAALAATLAAGASPLEAGTIAMLAAAVTVRKMRQTGSATPGEINALAKVKNNHRSKAEKTTTNPRL
jgi:rfaE bifunctional protein kinase chain/domain